MIYPIVAYGDPVLKQRAKEITPNQLDLKKLVDDMFETMYAASGVGLAAPQIGKSIRVFVVDAEAMDEDNLKGFKKAFINPQILEETGEKWAYEEGCLSIPKIREDVFRQPRVKLRYFDTDWKEYVEEFDGMAARVIQHEYDHLEGVLFTDYLSPFKRQLIKNKLGNISKGKIDVEYRMRFPAVAKAGRR
ncbi:peptide deformylase [Catalinimonas alkaloidigena]|uniref:Peptide deformylase n=1 Tax=Catalinimonas alkaloidigena TaxID=1075417 RepID=A0A1G9EYK2_9BACT|nr:peptide deformylase [Catalinimonas alkaloidigena]SDK81108.1 peptide deformylase [Catalinimonas alkaloidigena]